MKKDARSSNSVAFLISPHQMLLAQQGKLEITMRSQPLAGEGEREVVGLAYKVRPIVELD